MRSFFKRLKKFIPLIAIVSIAGVAVFFFTRPRPVIPVGLRTGVASVMDLRNTVDLTGTVQSDTSTNVYAPLSQMILEVLVEVGDYVEEGEVICRLDGSTIESNITTKQTTMYNSQRSNTLTQQQNQRDLEKAQSDLDKAINDLQYGENQAILQAQATVKEYEIRLEDAQVTYTVRNREYRDLLDRKHDGEDILDSQMNSALTSLNSARTNVETIEANLSEAKRKLERTRQDEQDKIDTLQAAVKTSEERVASSKISADQTADYISLENLKSDLAKCEITAPVSGTVTTVSAIEGATASGILFVLQDIDDLIVSTKIKEYDMGTVRLGQMVEIKTDATGDDVYQGELIHIAPASSNAGSGTTAEYPAKVRVTSKKHRMLVGMNARLNIITEQKPGVLAVPYDALATLAPSAAAPPPDGVPGEGEGAPTPSVTDLPADFSGSVLYVARQQEDGTYTAAIVPVIPGMETDFYVEVTGELQDGDIVILEHDGLVDGAPVTLDREVSAVVSGARTGIGGGVGGGMRGGSVRIGG